jgi:hypothetical protein
MIRSLPTSLVQDQIQDQYLTTKIPRAPRNPNSVKNRGGSDDIHGVKDRGMKQATIL